MGHLEGQVYTILIEVAVFEAVSLFTCVFDQNTFPIMHELCLVSCNLFVWSFTLLVLVICVDLLVFVMSCVVM